ncbi:lactonase family protein [Flavobacterium sp. AED]|uniref:lactonase family protein n=1 Tax=Flavobacterium sp. AED TaxID=1423323 RepID=UPI00057CE69C|nr:lactonase family protein [Flavobacterium sp. AED]KIA86291.1 6-phosphogluconolactonase [Flavobacterium sp. AED]
MTKTIATFLFTFFISFNFYSQNSYVFVGSYNSDKNKEGIYVFQLDTLTGNLKKITSVKNILNPSYLTVSPNGKYIFACTETKTPNAGSVSSFEFKPQNKTLTFINSQKSGGENPVYLSVHKNEKWLINANYTQGSVSVYPITTDGKINPIAQNFSYSEGSINKERQDRSHVHSAVFSPNYDFIFLPDLGADKIRSYRFDCAKEQPLSENQYPFTQTTLGSGPRHFTFHPDGKFAYCVEELTGTISVYKYEDGKLDAIQRINAHSEEFKEGFNSGDIHISPDGRFLYASNRGEENNIAIFSIESNGRLKTIGYQSTFGKTPRIFTIDSTGKFLIVANQSSGDVIVFKRNSVTGLLKKSGTEIKVENASCVQIKQYL